MKNKMISFAAIAALALGLVACAEELSDDRTYRPPTGEPGLGASFESKYNRYQKGQKHPGQNNAWKVQERWADTVWRNDRTHAQIVVWTNDDDYDDLSFAVSDLRNGAAVIDRQHVRLRFCSYILGDAEPMDCAAPDPRPEVWIADALTDTPPTRVTAEDPIKIWLSVDTPKDAAPGRYTGVFEVKSGGQTTHVLDIELLVADRVLPDVADWEFHLDLWQFPYALSGQCSPRVEMGSDEYFALMEPIYRTLADAGQKTITTYIKGGVFYAPDETMVRWTKRRDGSWSFDYTLFDRFVEKMMSWGITKQISCFSLAGWNRGVPYFDEAAGTDQELVFVDPTDTSGPERIGGAVYQATWNAFLDSFKAHLEAKGWFSRAVLYMDEIPHEAMREVIRVIREHDPAWKIGLAGSSLDAEMEAQMYDYSIFLTRQSQKSTPVRTFYTSCSHIHPNCYLTPQNSPAEMAWMAWHAAGNGYNGFLRWAYDNWRSGDPASARDTGATAGDASMVYYRNRTSDANGVVPSIRLELLREGIQDYEKIRILDDPQVNAFAAGIGETTASSAAFYVAAGEALLAKASVK